MFSRSCGDGDKPSVEIFLALHIEPTKRRWRWRKGKMKKSLKPYLSIVTKGPKLLSRAHAASLMKVKHLLAPRPNLLIILDEFLRLAEDVKSSASWEATQVWRRNQGRFLYSSLIFFSPLCLVLCVFCFPLNSFALLCVSFLLH